jgi:hypothetical protein
VHAQKKKLIKKKGSSAGASITDGKEESSIVTVDTLFFSVLVFYTGVVPQQDKCVGRTQWHNDIAVWRMQFDGWREKVGKFAVRKKKRPIASCCQCQVRTCLGTV